MRKIIHVDMDAFYAAVEQRDNPAYRGLPVIVGGLPNRRGVVATASYEARTYGIHSAMPSSRAVRLCPHAIFLPPRFEIYRAVSRQIRDIFLRFTELVEPLSLDEAYLDVTENREGLPSATATAMEIRRLIRAETGLTASAGVAPNKFLAKLASEAHKPDGLKVIPPHKILEFLKDLPVRKVHGIGPATEARMLELGIHTVSQLQTFTEEELIHHFGRAGSWYYRLARGEDERPVEPHSERKSLGAEDTFPTDLEDLEPMHAELDRLAARVWKHLERSGFRGRTVTLKVTYADFHKITRSRTLEVAPAGAEALASEAKKLLELTDALRKKVRLLGISISSPEKTESFVPGGQLWLPFPPRGRESGG